MTHSLGHALSANNKGANILVKIRLNDECKNGHIDFAITATEWGIGKPRNGKTELGSGCIHDSILKAFPELKMFVDLHLCDIKGRPMYAVGNGIYHIENSPKEVAKEYLRITDIEYEKLSNYICDSEVFSYMIEDLGIVERWEQEANKAVALLEEWTGQKITDNSVRYQYMPLSDEAKQDIKQKLESGYYSEENQQDRLLQKIDEANQKTVEKDFETINKNITKFKNYDKLLKLIIKLHIPLSNTIVYTHYKKLRVSFNWKSYESIKVTEKQVKRIASRFGDDIEIMFNEKNYNF